MAQNLTYDGVTTVTAVAGAIYPDGWLSPATVFSLVPTRASPGLRVTVWNPDLAAAYDGNTISVTVSASDTVVRQANRGDLVDLDLIADFQPDRVELVRIDSSAFLASDPVDARARGLVLVSLSLLTASTELS